MKTVLYYFIFFFFGFGIGNSSYMDSISCFHFIIVFVIEGRLFGKI